jgi:hypothetical protein
MELRSGPALVSETSNHGTSILALVWFGQGGVHLWRLGMVTDWVRRAPISQACGDSGPKAIADATGMKAVNLRVCAETRVTAVQIAQPEYGLYTP